MADLAAEEGAPAAEATPSKSVESVVAVKKPSKGEIPARQKSAKIIPKRQPLALKLSQMPVQALEQNVGVAAQSRTSGSLNEKPQVSLFMQTLDLQRAPTQLSHLSVDQQRTISWKNPQLLPRIMSPSKITHVKKTTTLPGQAFTVAKPCKSPPRDIKILQPDHTIPHENPDEYNKVHASLSDTASQMLLPVTTDCYKRMEKQRHGHIAEAAAALGGSLGESHAQSKTEKFQYSDEKLEEKLASLSGLAEKRREVSPNLEESGVQYRKVLSPRMDSYTNAEGEQIELLRKVLNCALKNKPPSPGRGTAFPFLPIDTSVAGGLTNAAVTNKTESTAIKDLLEGAGVDIAKTKENTKIMASQMMETNPALEDYLGVQNYRPNGNIALSEGSKEPRQARYGTFTPMKLLTPRGLSHKAALLKKMPKDQCKLRAMEHMFGVDKKNIHCVPFEPDFDRTNSFTDHVFIVMTFLQSNLGDPELFFYGNRAEEAQPDGDLPSPVLEDLLLRSLKVVTRFADYLIGEPHALTWKSKMYMAGIGQLLAEICLQFTTDGLNLSKKQVHCVQLYASYVNFLGIKRQVVEMCILCRLTRVATSALFFKAKAANDKKTPPKVCSAAPDEMNKTSKLVLEEMEKEKLIIEDSRKTLLFRIFELVDEFCSHEARVQLEDETALKESPVGISFTPMVHGLCSEVMACLFYHRFLLTRKSIAHAKTVPKPAKKHNYETGFLIKTLEPATVTPAPLPGTRIVPQEMLPFSNPLSPTHDLLDDLVVEDTSPRNKSVESPTNKPRNGKSGMAVTAPAGFNKKQVETVPKIKGLTTATAKIHENGKAKDARTGLSEQDTRVRPKSKKRLESATKRLESEMPVFLRQLEPGLRDLIYETDRLGSHLERRRLVQRDKRMESNIVALLTFYFKEHPNTNVYENPTVALLPDDHDVTATIVSEKGFEEPGTKAGILDEETAGLAVHARLSFHMTDIARKSISVNQAMHMAKCRSLPNDAALKVASLIVKANFTSGLVKIKTLMQWLRQKLDGLAEKARQEKSILEDRTVVLVKATKKAEEREDTIAADAKSLGPIAQKMSQAEIYCSEAERVLHALKVLDALQETLEETRPAVEELGKFLLEDTYEQRDFRMGFSEMSLHNHNAEHFVKIRKFLEICQALES